MPTEWKALAEAEAGELAQQKSWVNAGQTKGVQAGSLLDKQASRGTPAFAYLVWGAATTPPVEYWRGSSLVPLALEQELQARIAKLEKRVMALERRLRKSLNKSRLERRGEKVVVLRTVSRDEAKSEIKNLFSSGKVLYFSDVARRLNLDLRMVVEICRELQREGEIEVAEH